MSMEEIWKGIEGYDGKYMISNHGNVIGTSKNIILSQVVNTKSGYRYVTLKIKKPRKTVPIHRLVALAFIPNPENKPTVNHKDGDKQNNYYLNLEWATYSENNKHIYSSRLRISKNRGSATNTRIMLDMGTGVFYDCMKDAAEAFDINYNSFKSIFPKRTNLKRV